MSNLSNKQIEYLKSIKPHFCLPAYGGMISESFFVSFMKLINTFILNGISYGVDTIVNESLVSRARNSLTACMMAAEPKSTHLIFIDADIDFTPDSIIKLLLSDKDVIGGIYPKKTLPISYVLNTLPEQKVEGTCVKVKRTGTGFLCIKREVIQKLFDAHPELKYIDNTGLRKEFEPYTYALFDTLIKDNQYLSEDYTFCDRWIDLGGEIWVDLSIRLGHTGHYKFMSNQSPLEQAIESQKTLQMEKLKNKTENDQT